MKNIKLLQGTQIFLLAAGSLYAWYIIIREFINFYANEGTIFKVTNCIYTNPVTTPCFYGGLGFLVALSWAWYIWSITDQVKDLTMRIWHTWFVLGCTIFAWSIVSWEWWQIKQAAGQPVAGCSGLMTSIFDSSCLYGASFFLLSLLTGWYILNIQKKKTS